MASRRIRVDTIQDAIQALKEADDDVDEGRVRKAKVHTTISLDCEVHEDYDCMLNLTDIGRNANKFYVAQVLKKGEKYFTWNRWGRVGYPVQGCELKGPSTVEEAIKGFNEKFFKKTENKWKDRAEFVPKGGDMYTLIEMSADDEDEDEVDAAPEMREKMPLGKLSKAQIAKGLECLNDIQICHEDNNVQMELERLTSRFYTVIPHRFGLQVRPPIITQNDLRAKQNMLLDLGGIEIEVEPHPL